MSSALATPSDLLDAVDRRAREAWASLAEEGRVELGQVSTPPAVAREMASMLCAQPSAVHLVDAGAGVGTLTAATVSELLGRSERPRSIRVSAFEIDPHLLDDLHWTLERCREACAAHGVLFDAHIEIGDFVERALSSGLRDTATVVMLNPPYFKLRASSEMRRRVRRELCDTPNAYAAFTAVAVELLSAGGELVAITPRSYCNGAYFRSFRAYLLERVLPRRFHIYESRSEAFARDSILQENVILHAQRAVATGKDETVLSVGSNGSSSWALKPLSEVALPGDPEQFLHIDAGSNDRNVARAIHLLPATLSDLDMTVSTGRVVDFRSREALRFDATGRVDEVPLLYPGHLVGAKVNWPRAGFRKANALARTAETERLLVPDGTYVLVKRFSTKEEARRVSPTVLHKGELGADAIAFENHLNYFHRRGCGLEMDEAVGLAIYLGSTQVDQYFRGFSGHTQVNATDLRNIRYPDVPSLSDVGRHGRRVDLLDQAAVDELASGFFN